MLPAMTFKLINSYLAYLIAFNMVILLQLGVYVFKNMLYIVFMVWFT